MGTFDNYDRALKDALDDQYRKAESTGLKQAVNLPAGKYQAYISRTAFIDNTKDYTDPHDMCDHILLIELTVIGGTYDGNMVNKWYPISLNGMKRLKPDLITLGCEWTGLDGLDRTITNGQLLDLIVDLTATEKRKDDKVYHNIWIDRNTGNRYCPISGGQDGSNGSGYTFTPTKEKLPWED